MDIHVTTENKKILDITRLVRTTNMEFINKVIIYGED